ncbi:hypothetical protein DL240_18730, partial [Lujinxingia litoralis]
MYDVEASLHELNRLLLGRYRVLRVLKEGDQGTTYLAQNSEGRSVALRELTLPAGEPERARELFEQERRALARGGASATTEAFSLDDGWGGERFFLVEPYARGLDPGGGPAPLSPGPAARHFDTPEEVQQERQALVELLTARALVLSLERLKRAGLLEPTSSSSVSMSVTSSVSSKSSPSPSRSGWGLLPTVIGVLAMALLISNCGRFSAKVAGYEATVFEPLRQCAEARALLGEAIELPVLGCQKGSTSFASASGHANWTIPVAGSRARGTYIFHASKSHGGWTLHNGILKVDDQVINV